MNYPASKLTLTPEGRYAYVMSLPPGVPLDGGLARQQERTGLRLLIGLNRAMHSCPCGGRCGPFRDLMIFNDPDIADAAGEDASPYWWGVIG